MRCAEQVLPLIRCLLVLIAVLQRQRTRQQTCPISTAENIIAEFADTCLSSGCRGCMDGMDVISHPEVLTSVNYWVGAKNAPGNGRTGRLHIVERSAPCPASKHQQVCERASC
mmetsp:Transcript_8271/g.10811  ORF Transcript_8271/g.10811 Transcript_8271/m.10811 type:complete len:113 (-) Transcript_8271:78-416(-)